MKSSSLSILGLTVLLGTAPALQANDTENSSWLAPFSRNSFIYPALGFGAAFIIYKLYTNYTQSPELDVIAPWYEEERTPVAADPVEVKHNEPRRSALRQDGQEEISVTEEAAPTQEHKATILDFLNPEHIDIIESCISLFVEAYGPQLVTLHMELANPDLPEEDREQYSAMLSQLEHEAPDFAQTVPALMMYVPLLKTVEDSLLEQAATEDETKRNIINAEFISLLNTIDSLIYYIHTFAELYGDAYNQPVMDTI